MADERIYKRISKRTEGQIYIGVCGPVRTGKSTFIKSFMELMVIPYIENQYIRQRVIDSLPQSGDGRTITTTEPKFVPEEAALIDTGLGKIKVRMADCPGYPVDGALGFYQDGKVRMVKTPWDEEPVPFDKAAVTGTNKVICDHSTVGILITSDGSLTGIERESYIKAEEQTIKALDELHKPFCIVLNSDRPESPDTIELAKELSSKYNAMVIPCDCKNLSESEVYSIFDALLMQFPLTEVYVQLPHYVNALGFDHPVKKELIKTLQIYMNSLDTVKDSRDNISIIAENNFVKKVDVEKIDLAIGRAFIVISLNDELYYSVIGELLGESINSDVELFASLTRLSEAKARYDELKDALKEVNNCGYSMVPPKIENMEIEEPEIFRQGSKHGVRMIAKSSCLHLIKTDLTTEISPIVGSIMQSEELADYLNKKMTKSDDNNEIWSTNLFGKTIQEMAMEQMQEKVNSMPADLKLKIQKSLQKISNEGKDYFICIII